MSGHAPLELRNGRTTIAIDPRTGSILRIEDAQNGWAHIDARRGGRQDGRLFRVVTPGGFWWSCYADSQEQPHVLCRRQGNGLVLEYPDLVAADKEQTGISARMEIRPSEETDEFLFSMCIENHGSRTVLDAAFPLLGGWHEQDGPSRFALGANGFSAPQNLAHSWGNNYARNGKRAGWHYPVELACPWVDVHGPHGGLSYLNYMTEGLNGKFWIDNLAGYGDDFRLMLGWLHFVMLRPGQTWTSPPMGLAVHDGDWRWTADRYRAWFDQRHPPDYSRPAIRSRIGFQNVFFRGFDGTPIRPLESIPQAAAAARRYGVDLLCVWDRLTLGNYARLDARDLTDYPSAERDTIRRGLRQAEAEGTRTCALVNFRHPNAALHLSDPALPTRVKRRFDGTFHTENWVGNHNFGDIWSKHVGPESYVFSPFSAAHQERILRLTRDYLDLGYSSIFYDQPFEYQPDYSRNEHDPTPNATHHAALQLVSQVRRLLLEQDSQAVVIGEESDIHATPYIDQWMSWSIAGPSSTLLERLALMRYSMPHTILSWVVDHEPERTTHAFAMGMQLCLMVHGGEATLEDEPQFGQYVAALAALRKATAERTVMARFVGRNGLTVDGDENFVAWGYESDAGPAVIVASPGRAAKGRVTVERDAFRVSGRPAEGAVFRLSGLPLGMTGDTQEFALGANEAAVWTL